MPPKPPALILTAGLGTRLRPLTEVRAKAAIPVAGEPLIRRSVRWLVSQGVTEIVLNLHHRPETIAAEIGDGSDLGARVRYSWEQPVLLGTAGGPRQALSIVGAGTFFLVNGDTLADVDLAGLVEAHQTTGASVTLALQPNHQPDRYGGAQLDGEQRVTGFVRRGRADGSYHVVGVQLVDAGVFAPLPAGQPASSIGGVYDTLIASRPGAIRGFVSGTGTFWDIGTVADYWLTSWSFAQAEGIAGNPSGRNVGIDPTARVSRSILWDDVEIAGGCVVDECVVTDGVRVPRGARYHRTILLPAADGSVRTAPLSR
ncbi:MAG: NDP-sugar synthase [Acidobacteriota bacterium]